MLAKNSVPLNQERYGHRKRSFQPEWNSTKLYIYSHVDLSKSAKLADTWVSGIHQGCEVVRIAIMVVYESNWPCLTPLEPVMELNDCGKHEWICRRHTKRNRTISAEPKPEVWSEMIYSGLAIYIQYMYMFMYVVVHIHVELMCYGIHEVKWSWICIQVCPKAFSFHILSILIVNHGWRETLIMHLNYPLLYAVKMKHRCAKASVHNFH